MSELSAAAAAALGVPEAIVERSAAARATETGMSVDEVLNAWAGGGAIEAPPAEPSTDEPPAESVEETPVAEKEPAEEEPADKAPAPAPDMQEPAAAAVTQPAAVTRSPIPARVTTAEAANLPEVITVPTAGIRERTNFAIPRWLAAVLLIIPAFALFALGGSATGECGAATELTTDVITGEIVNCDGSEFTGSGAGGGGADLIAQGEALYNGAPACAGCHGANGGGGVGPALGPVLTTFGSCTDHIEWVTLGSTGFQAAGESTYGDANKTINGGMPSFGNSLSPEQVASVAAFERVRFGGANPEEALADCGLTPAEGEEGDEGGAPGEETPGDEAPEGEETTTTTESGAEASSATSG